MTKIAIFGGAGFIGSQLTNILKNSGYDVCIFDAMRNFSKVENFEEIMQQRKPFLNGVKIEIGDTRDRIHVKDFIEREKPEIVVMLAAIACAKPRVPFKESIIDINLNGTIIVTEECAKSQFVNRLIFASSSMAYGNFPHVPLEEGVPLAPTNLYGATKASGEMMVRQIMGEVGKEWIIIRPSAVYGPRSCNLKVIEIFIKAAMSGKDSISATEGEILDFTYVEDAAEAFFLAIQTKNCNSIYNATRGESRSVEELAEIIKTYFPNLKIIKIKKDGENPERGQLDISKAKKLLGFSPKVSLEDGVKKSILFEESILKK